ncbi:MAG: hypothetical protein HJJLKODD_01918 [Phycisphaerae bacterium]|nr:hypothetical protein [Phycisphaerae bacterium]
MTRETAWQLLQEYTQSESLRRHALAVEAALRHYAVLFGEEVERWGLVGLLHDFDYERYPAPPEHTRAGADILRRPGVDEEIVGAILSHGDWNLAEYPRDSQLRKCIYAVDELCGFIMAVAYVRPTRLAGMEAASVKKKMKDKAFAAAVSRDDIRNGAEQLGLPLDDHITNCIQALQPISSILGL